MALEATIGGANSNSYQTVEAATEIIGSLLNVSEWEVAGGVSPPKQEAALITACFRLEQESYRGSRASATQALSWPRVGVRIDGILIEDDVIPVILLRAQAKLAVAMLREDLLVDTGLEGFEEVKIGPIEIKTRMRSGGTLPADVRSDISQLLYASPSQFQMWRA